MQKSSNEPGRSLWRDLRGAFGNEHFDWLRLPVPRTVVLLSIPMVLELSLQSLFGIVDMLFVGRLGSDAVAIVGLTGALIAVIFAVAGGVAIAAAAMVARRIGEDRPAEASKSAAQALLLGIIVSIPFAVIGIVFAKELLELMGLHDQMSIHEGRGFTAIMFGGNTTIFLLFVLNAIFRGAGEPGLAFRTLCVANVLNAALDPLLIFGLGPVPAFGVEGAAIATTVSRVVAIVYQVHLLRSGRSRLRIRVADFVPAASRLRGLLGISAWGTLQGAIPILSWLGMMRVVAVFGEQAVAGYTVAIRVMLVALLPAMGLGNAVVTLVGQNLGAGAVDRAERAVRITLTWSIAVLLFVTVLVELAAHPIARAFIDDPRAVHFAVLCLRITAVGFPLFGIAMVLSSVFNGAGDTLTPMWMSIVVYWVVQAPLAWVLAISLNFQAEGVFSSFAVALTLFALLAWWRFRRGTWKHARI